MKTITNEIKAKIFAQYLGHKTKDTLNRIDNLTPLLLHGIKQDFTNDYNHKLILKPLSVLTNEDAIECSKLEGLVNAKVSQIGVGGIMLKDDTYELLLSFDCEILLYKNGLKQPPVKSFLMYQYLISKGYDLPQYLLDGKTIHESGLAIYEN